LETLDVIEKSLRAGFEINLRIGSAKCIRLENRLLVESSSDKYNLGEALLQLLNPHSLPLVENITPLDPAILAKLKHIMDSRKSVEITYSSHSSMFEMKDAIYSDSQKPRVCCGGMSARGKSLLEVIDNMIIEIAQAQARVAQRSRGGCSVLK